MADGCRGTWRKGLASKISQWGVCGIDIASSNDHQMAATSGMFPFVSLSQYCSITYFTRESAIRNDRCSKKNRYNFDSDEKHSLFSDLFHSTLISLSQSLHNLSFRRQRRILRATTAVSKPFQTCISKTLLADSKTPVQHRRTERYSNVHGRGG